ncbi:hypothetical protein BN7_4173 [Wickerhamomyces ciferrii]|uniref:Uncharacterized protein n=1 Tax=Wickerhamomyces ciferrii (strain ATCC 14091 / BCRC 22168 / CBS 111 / JCM 3599 / NBRC 0793 / NRRL Y-1031 F-60-10) TaxID=1206466 RepID=K0KTA7_WICCF|nr:uncharacterized protein BN7_4173 [Wickerhamomyces ciferrii]CCH44604.1 hypothetical protein BN7_4173 [Wickerhamomyces ciferrii]
MLILSLFNHISKYLLNLVSGQIKPIAILNAGWKYDITKDIAKDPSNTLQSPTKAYLEISDDKIYHELNSNINFVGGATPWVSVLLYLLTAISQIIANRKLEQSCGYGHRSIQGVRYAYSTKGYGCKNPNNLDKSGSDMENVVELLHRSIFHYDILEQNEQVLCISISPPDTEWTGWLAIGPSKSWNNNIWCGPSDKHDAKGNRDDVNEQEKNHFEIQRFVTDKDLNKDGVSFEYDEGVLFLSNDQEDGSNDLLFW